MAGADHILEIFDTYFGSTIFGVFFILSVVYCLITKPKYKKHILLGVLLLVIILYNDFSYAIVGKLTGEGTTYYRFLWILPVTLVVAYVVVDILSKLEKTNLKVIFIVGLLAVIAVEDGAASVDTVSIPENAYNISDDVIQVSTIINRDYGEGNGDSIETMLDKRVAVPTSMEMSLRTYDASVSFGISREAYIYVAENGLGNEDTPYPVEEVVIAAVKGHQTDYTELRNCIDMLEIKYIVCPIKYGMDAYFSYAGCELVGYSENYGVYKVMPME